MLLWEDVVVGGDSGAGAALCRMMQQDVKIYYQCGFALFSRDFWPVFVSKFSV